MLLENANQTDHKGVKPGGGDPFSCVCECECFFFLIEVSEIIVNVEEPKRGLTASNSRICVRIFPCHQ